MAGTVDIYDLPEYGAVYEGEISSICADISAGGLDIEGMVGDDVEFSVFFDYLNLTGYTFTALTVLNPPPLKRVYPITVTPVDLTVGLITLSLSDTDTGKIGPVARKPWFLNWSKGTEQRTVLMGRLYLSRKY